MKKKELCEAWTLSWLQSLLGALLEHETAKERGWGGEG
jgi:hypothetical protein